MLRIRCFASFAFAVLTTPLAAQAAVAPQDCLPASSYAAISFAGLERCSAVADSHAAALLIRQFLQRVPQATFDEHIGRELERAAEHLRRHLAEGGVSAANLRAALRRPVALGIGRPTLRGMGLSVALVVDEGNAGADLDALFANLVQRIKADEPELHEGQATVDGHACRTLEGPGFPSVLLARERGIFVLTNSEGYLREIFATAGGKQPSLARASVLGAGRARLGAAPMVEAFAHTGPLLATVEPLLPYEAAEVGQLLGANNLAGIYAGAAPATDGTVETLDLALTGAHSGLLKAAFSGPADLGAAAFCSEDTVAFGSVHLDAPAAFAAFDQVLAALPAGLSAQAGRQLSRNLQRALRGIGVEPQQADQLMRAMGGSLSVAVTLGKGAMPLPELLVMLPVRDEQVVSQWLERLIQLGTERAGIQWSTRAAGDRTIHYCAVANAPFPMTPSLVLANGYLLISTQSRILTQALEQKGSTDGSLLAAEDFTAAAAANKSATAFVHLRPSRGLERNWCIVETWLLPLLDAQEDELGFGRDAIPDQEAFVRGFGTLTFSATVDDEGVHLRSRSNFGIGGLLAGGARVLDDLLQRAAGKVY